MRGAAGAADGHFHFDFADEVFFLPDEFPDLPNAGEERPKGGGHPARESRLVLALEAFPGGAGFFQMGHGLAALRGGFAAWAGSWSSRMIHRFVERVRRLGARRTFSTDVGSFSWVPDDRWGPEETPIRGGGKTPFLRGGPSFRGDRGKGGKGGPRITQRGLAATKRLLDRKGAERRERAAEGKFVEFP